MQMITKAKEELDGKFRHNDEMREEERVHMDEVRDEERVIMAQSTIIISSESSALDDSLETSSFESSDAGKWQIPTKPVTSSNKLSIFSAKHKSGNEETSLKQPHQDALTLKQETFEIIKWLHIK